MMKRSRRGQKGVRQCQNIAKQHVLLEPPRPVECRTPQLSRFHRAGRDKLLDIHGSA